MKFIIMVAIGGALGSLSRYGIEVIVNKNIPHIPLFPLVTWSINTAGSFGIGNDVCSDH